jgi:ATP-binding cassette subfamily B multidrug efflux pump
MVKLILKRLRGLALFCAIGAPLLMIIEVFSDLQQPTLMARIVDVGVAAGNLSYVLHTGLIMIFFALLGAVGGMGCSVLANYAALKLGGNLRKEMMRKIQNLSTAEIDKLETSSLITRMTNDITQMQNMVLVFTRGMVRSPLLCLGGIAMSFIICPKLAMIICISVPILAIVTIYVIARTVPMFTRVQNCIDGMNNVMRENLLGIRVIKSFTLEEQQFTRFTAANEKLARENVDAQCFIFILAPIMTLLMNLSIVAVLWFGGNMQIAGTLQPGKIIAFVNYMIMIAHSLVFMVGMITSFSRADASSTRILEVLDIQPSVIDTPQPQTPLNNDITFDKVSFRYNTGDYVLRDISFKLPEGQKIGVIGSTGCGKSTIASLLVRFYDVTQGSIKIGGTDIREIPLNILRKKVGVVLQESLLFSGTVEENLRYGNPLAETNLLNAAIEKAQAKEFLDKMPRGLASTVEQRGKNFSGGQKQRLSIARSLLHDPDILILDDSTSALDLATDARLQSALRHCRQGKTTILIAQRVASLMDCDTILVMENGKLNAAGTHASLLQSCPLYRSIAVSQLGEEVLSNG